VQWLRKVVNVGGLDTANCNFEPLPLTYGRGTFDQSILRQKLALEV
jgi:hypothetical protein